ncbi:hypothetical protein NKG94_31660 [Micromonospora sp. M12]
MRAFLGEVRAAHQAELRDLRGLLAAGNVPELNIHEGHQMPGMVTETGLAELRAAPDTEVPSGRPRSSGPISRRRWCCVGRADRRGSPEVKALAGRIQQARAAELSTLDRRPGAHVAAPVN